MAKEGTNIQAVKSGTVTHSGWLELGGWRLSIKDQEGLTHYYAHMMEKSMLKAGDKVNIGDVIGQVGSTGYSKTEGTKGKFDPHLHYGVYKNGKAINPTDYLKGATSVNSDAIDSQNESIKAYNEALSKQQSAFDKNIQLEQTLIDLQKQKEEVMRKTADSMLSGNDRILSDIEKTNAQLTTRQSLYKSDDDEYMKFEAEKINNMLKQQVVLNKNANQIRDILAENNSLIAGGEEGFLTGDMLLSLTDKLKDYGNQWWEVEKSLRETQVTQRLQNINDVFDDMTLRLSPLTNSIGLLGEKFSLLSDVDFEGKFDVLADSFDSTRNKLSMLREEYSKLGDISPQTAQEATELADKMSDVAAQIFESNKAIADYQKQIDMLKVEEMSSAYQGKMDKLSSVLASFKNNLDMLDGGIREGQDISFGVNTLPEIPKSAIEAKRKELESMIDEQRKYEEEILSIREMSFDEQEAKNNEFLTAIREYMTEHYGEVVDNVANSLGTELNLQNSGQAAIYEAIISS